jgi:hypothetical protein
VHKRKPRIQKWRKKREQEGSLVSVYGIYFPINAFCTLQTTVPPTLMQPSPPEQYQRQ